MTQPIFFFHYRIGVKDLLHQFCNKIQSITSKHILIYHQKICFLAFTCFYFYKGGGCHENYTLKGHLGLRLMGFDRLNSLSKMKIFPSYSPIFKQMLCICGQAVVLEGKVSTVNTGSLCSHKCE